MPTVVIPVARANHWHSPHWLLWVNQQIRRYSIKAVTDVYLFYSIPVLISGIHFQKMVCEFILFKKIKIFQVHSVTRNWKTLNPSSQYAFIVTTSVFATKTSNWTDLPTHICNLPVVSFNVGPAFQNYCFHPFFRPTDPIHGCGGAGAHHCCQRVKNRVQPAQVPNRVESRLGLFCADFACTPASSHSLKTCVLGWLDFKLTSFILTSM